MVLTGGLTIRGLLLGKRDTDAEIGADRSADQQSARKNMRLDTSGRWWDASPLGNGHWGGRDEERNERKDKWDE